MTPLDPARPRAVGRRITYDQVPEALRDWIARKFGTVRVLVEHVGGMSPGCAVTLETSQVGAIFVKAVGPELNPHTPDLFRQEIAVLRELAAVPYRPALLATYDDGTWVGLALEHVSGRYPDLSSDDDFTAVARTVEAQVVELTPAPALDVPSLAATARRWRDRWSDVCAEPHRFLPPWAAERIDDLIALVAALPAQLEETTLCHFDIRDDNIIVRPNGQAVVLDWGMARRGPAWTDLVLLAAQRPTAHEAQAWIDHWVPVNARGTVTSLLVAFAGSQAWNSRQPPKPALPTFAQFTREDADRLFAIAGLRLCP